MKCYWKLQNARVIAFMVSELLKESPTTSPPFPQHHHADWFSSNSVYLNHSKLNSLSLSDDFSFLDQICLTKKSLILRQNSGITIKFTMLEPILVPKCTLPANAAYWKMTTQIFCLKCPKKCRKKFLVVSNHLIPKFFSCYKIYLKKFV